MKKFLKMTAAVGALALAPLSANALPTNLLDFNPDGTGAFQENGVSELSFEALGTTVITVDTSTAPGAAGGVLTGSTFTESFQAVVTAITNPVFNSACVFCEGTAAAGDELFINVDLGGTIIDDTGSNLFLAFSEGSFSFEFGGNIFAGGSLVPPDGLGVTFPGGAPNAATFGGLNFAFDFADDNTLFANGLDLEDLLADQVIALAFGTASTVNLSDPIPTGDPSIVLFEAAEVSGEIVFLVPGPAPLALLGLGVLGIALRRRRG